MLFDYQYLSALCVKFKYFKICSVKLLKYWVKMVHYFIVDVSNRWFSPPFSPNAERHILNLEHVMSLCYTDHTTLWDTACRLYNKFSFKSFENFSNSILILSTVLSKTSYITEMYVSLHHFAQLLCVIF